MAESIASHSGSGDVESIGVRDEDEAVEFGDGEWLRGKAWRSKMGSESESESELEVLIGKGSLI